MTKGPGRAGWTALTLLAGIVAVLWLQPYSFFSPYRPYSEPARQFLRAALAHDSVGLQRQAASSEPVEWALEAARGDPNSLAVWARLSRPYSGLRSGDTTTIVFQTSTRTCYLQPVVMSFLRGSAGLRVLSASSACFADHRE